MHIVSIEKIIIMSKIFKNWWSVQLKSKKYGGAIEFAANL
jgi:hypothetical protein